MVAQYTYGLLFKQDQFGRYYASPYDVFLRMNHLPVQPKAGETIAAVRPAAGDGGECAQQSEVGDATYGKFEYHAQPFQFGATELAGLKIFLNDGDERGGRFAACGELRRRATSARTSRDFDFHNTGVAQEEYDNANGTGAFMALTIPNSGGSYGEFRSVHAGFGESSERRASNSGITRWRGSRSLRTSGLWNVYPEPGHSESAERSADGGLRESRRIARWIKGSRRRSRNSKRRCCATWKIRRRIFTMAASDSLSRCG